ncbi:MAG TPA: formimidoylglutamate deiminase, partial [Steroidobacteraceae bacterium]|nr:formimidoylglutamate deiminase [Steroidobacteraceae bacterium]
AKDVRIAADGGRIVSITAGQPAQPDDERHALGVPGIPNLHSHAFQRGLAGLTERRGASTDSFWSWRELMYQFVGRMEPQDLESVTALAYAEMLEAGFTEVGEFHYLHHDRDGRPYADPAELATRIAAAAEATGIGLTLLPVFYAHASFGGSAPAERQRRFVSDPHSYARLLEAARAALRPLAGAGLGIAPHSLRAVTPEELAAILPLAGTGPVHIHIAEQVKEVEDCLKWSGRRPVEWLLEHAPVDARWCLVHATHATPAELQGIAASGAVAGLCPMTEASLGDGIFPAVAFTAGGGRYGIGSDSNVRLDAAEELRLLEYSQRLEHRARNVLAGAGGASTGRALFDAALAGGAQALGTRAPAPGLAPGAWLNLVSLRAHDAALTGRRGDEVLDSWIFCGGRQAVDCVWRAGAKVVRDGRHHRHEALRQRYAAAVGRLLQ